MNNHYCQVKSDYVVVFLAKHNPGSNWSHITAAEKAAADAKKKSDADDAKIDDKADPSASLMNVRFEIKISIHRIKVSIVTVLDDEEDV